MAKFIVSYPGFSQKKIIPKGADKRTVDKSYKKMVSCNVCASKKTCLVRRHLPSRKRLDCLVLIIRPIVLIRHVCDNESGRTVLVL